MTDDQTINIETGEKERILTRTGFEILVQDREGLRRRFPVCYQEVLLGSLGDKPVDIELGCSQVANRQAAFHYSEGALFFTNLDSSNPIMLNGVPTTFSPLKDGDQLSLLGYLLQVFHLNKGMATLEGCTGSYQGRTWAVDKEAVTIGRGAGKRPNTVDIDDRTVSRAHATILFQDGKFLLRADTQNSPVRVNGNPVREQEVLNNGALIQLGQQLLRFRIAEVEKERRELVSQEATILFSDVWNYSSFAESQPLEETVLQMNEFYSALGKTIKAHQGILLTFLGDAMMAVFGTEGQQDDGARLAVQAALAMQESLNELNQRWAEEGRPTLEAGIGINSGEVMVGDVGFTGKYEFAAMGDNTNLAARVEKLTREKNRKLIITGATRALLGNDYTWESLGSTKVKGREAPVELFSVATSQSG